LAAKNLSYTSTLFVLLLVSLVYRSLYGIFIASWFYCIFLNCDIMCQNPWQGGTIL